MGRLHRTLQRAWKDRNHRKTTDDWLEAKVAKPSPPLGEAAWSRQGFLGLNFQMSRVLLQGCFLEDTT